MENARVLTSNEFLKELEEKEKLKAEKEAQKQLQKMQREEKRAQKTGTKKVQSIVMNQLVPGRIVPIQELVVGCSATTAMSGTTVYVKEHPTVM